MAFESIFSSDGSEQRWVDQITKHFDKEVAIDVEDLPVSVFIVPKSITVFKPEAYVPRAIALGPYHHFQPHLYHMERFKLAAVKEYLTPDQITDFQSLVIDKLKEIDPTIRACYHRYLDLDHDTLAWIVAIDGIFLLHLLRDYSDVICSKERRIMAQNSVLCGDVMVLENQIPVILLKKIREFLRLSSPNYDDDDEDDELELFAMLKGFCQVHSPLKLTHMSYDWDNSNHLHLLDLMYHSTVNHRKIESTARHLKFTKVSERATHAEIKQDNFITNMGEIVDVGLTLGIGKKVLKPVAVIRKMPWEKISNLLGIKRGDNNGEENSQSVEEIDIPSVSRLYHYGGITFSHTVGGIRDIKFVTSDATLYLPVITLNANSEVVLRNLVAYEAATSESTCELAQYVDLMCGMIDTAEDASLLKEKGIIKGDLSNEAIANLFNGINKSTGNEGYKIIDMINGNYNKRPVVKAYKIMKKRVYDSWKALTVISTVVLFLLLLLHSFCQVYGCPHFFGRN